MKTSRWLALFVALVLAAPAVAALAATSLTDDEGDFLVYDRGRQVAREHFSYEQMGDSIVVGAEVARFIATPGEKTELHKKMVLVVDAFDYGLRSYVSNQHANEHMLVRGIVPGDTAFTSYREYDGAGTADRLAAPPGRMFILDPQLFTVFDVICRNLHGKVFAKRPINLIALGREDNVFEATVIDAGRDTLRWGGKRVVARRLHLEDRNLRFTMWMSPAGRMLKLEQLESGLSVVRDPHPKPAPKTAKVEPPVITPALVPERVPDFPPPHH